MFRVGDYVVMSSTNPCRYRITDKDTYLKVVEIVNRKDIKVAIVARRNSRTPPTDTYFTVEAQYFEYAPPIEKWWEGYTSTIGKSYYYSSLMSQDYTDYLQRRKEETQDMAYPMMELKMVQNKYDIPKEQLDYYANEIMQVLPKYQFKDGKNYNPTPVGLSALLAEYNKNKGWMYPYFMSHPNYVGNGKIAFTTNYHRKVNVRGVKEFLDWFKTEIIRYYANNCQLRICDMTYSRADDNLTRVNRILTRMNDLNGYTWGQGHLTVVINGKTYNEWCEEKKYIQSIKKAFSSVGIQIDGRYYSKQRATELKGVTDFIDYLYKNCASSTTGTDKAVLEKMNNWLKPINVAVASNQKYSRLIGKIAKKIGIDKLSSYLPAFTKLGDDINELEMKKYTVISINPLDYLTMSFGNSWSSCHTVDKTNLRHQNNGYSGGYCGGTLSYMLDGASIIFYTVDNRYEGTDFEYQPKANRCVFNIGQDKIIQGRVYPQSNDGDDTIYHEIRNTMQQTVAEMFGVKNTWYIKKGASECEAVTTSTGVHYRDYLHFSSCNVSYLKPEEGKSKNTKMVAIGHTGICVSCGKEISREGHIICSSCQEGYTICPHCGRKVRNENLHTIDGQVYCDECAFFCDYHQKWEFHNNRKTVWTNIRKSGWSGITHTNSLICQEAFNAEKNKRYKKCYDNYGAWIDTQSYTEGIETGDGYYFLRKSELEPTGFCLAYNGKYYVKASLKYDRHIKQYIPTDEWNKELNCWVGIEKDVKEQQEKLRIRAEKRAAKEAARAITTTGEVA